jgi:hypothetical protein
MKMKRFMTKAIPNTTQKYKEVVKIAKNAHGNLNGVVSLGQKARRGQSRLMLRLVKRKRRD